MSARPVVSIAIRAFRRRWLGQAIASVLAQTHTDLELIVYDDAGDLRGAAEQFGDARIRYHRPDHRLPASGRFADAVAVCRGDYIGLLDDDDFYEPRFVAELIAALEADPQAGLAFCETAYDASGTRFRRPVPAFPRSHPDTLEAILSRRQVITPSMMLMRREAYEDAMSPQSMPLNVNPDLFVTARVATSGWGVAAVDKALTTRRLHAGQVSRPGLEGSRREAATYAALDVGPGAEPLRRQMLAANLARVAMFELAAGDRPAAMRSVKAATTAAPDSVPGSRLLVGLAVHLPGIGPAAARVGAALVRLRARRRTLGRLGPWSCRRQRRA